jgi:hypothetical protein
MTTFLSILRLEFRRSRAKWNVVAWLAIFAVSIIYTNQGINGIKSLAQKEKSFKEIQNAKFEKIRSYNIYKFEGVSSLFAESTPSILFSNSIIPPDAASKIDGHVTVDLVNKLKSKILDPANLSYNMDFSGIVLLLVPIYCLFLGYESVSNRAFLKLLARGRSRIPLYAATVLSRFIAFALHFCILFFSLLLFIKLRGVRITAADFAGFRTYLFAALVFLFFFYSIGVVIGAVCKIKAAFALTVAVWFAFIFMIPGLINTSIANNIPDAMADYETVIDKLKILTDFEKRIVAKHGKPKSGTVEEARKVMEGFKNNELIRMEELERRLKDKCIKGINMYSKYAMFSPGTFYLLTGNEVSSRGYKSFVEFYDHTEKLKRDFFNFYVNEMFYEQSKKVRNFFEVTGRSNIFYAQSRRPDHFTLGILVNLGYSFILLVVAYFLLSLTMFPRPKVSYSGDFTLDLYKGKITSLNTVVKDFRKQVVNVFFGVFKHFPGKIELDGENILAPGQRTPLYLPQPGGLPDDIRGIDLLTIFKNSYKLDEKEFAEMVAGIGDNVKKCFGKMHDIDKFRTMLAIAELKQWDVCIIDRWIGHLTGEHHNEILGRVQGLAGENKFVLDIVTNWNLWLKHHNSFYTVYDYQSDTYHIKKRYTDSD